MARFGRRPLLLTLCAFTALLTTYYVIALLVWPRTGAIGWNTPATNDVPFRVTITWIKPGFPGDRGGLRAGDVFDFRDLSVRDRAEFSSETAAGTVFHFLIHRNGTVRHITVKTIPFHDRTITWDWWMGYFASWLMIAFGFLIALRRSASTRGVLLTLFLLSLALSNLTTPSFITLSPELNIVANTLLNLMGWLATVLWVAFAASFARPLSPLRKAATMLTYAVAAALMLHRIAWAAGVFTAWFDPNSTRYWNFEVFGNVPLCAFALTAGIAAVFAARGEERQSIAWAVIATSAMFIISPFTTILISILPWVWNTPPWPVLLASNLATIFVSIGIAYSILNRRLLDITFAINTVAVFTGVSIVVVGAFVLVESLFNEWFRETGRVTNTAVNVALALALGFSIRFIHRRVDHVVDNVFFRRRHEDERALRRFAHEAAFVTNPDVLMTRTIRNVQRHAQVEDVYLVVRNAKAYRAFGEPGSPHIEVPENDPALVAMRAWHETADLRDFETVLRGEYAFPMIARGQLIGALVCGTKRGGEAYAPDESDALATLASNVASALDTLLMRSERDEALIERLDRLNATMERVASLLSVEARTISQP